MSVINREMISKSIRFLNSFKEGDKYINTFKNIILLLLNLFTAGVRTDSLL